MKVQKCLLQGNAVLPREIYDASLLWIEFIDQNGNVFRVSWDKEDVLSISTESQIAVEPQANNSIVIKNVNF